MERAVAAILLSPLFFTRLSYATDGGDMHPYYRSCTESCEKTGMFMDTLLVHACKDLNSVENPGFERSAPSPVLFSWDCHSECHYLCVKDTESKRRALLEAPMKYYGEWPLTRYLNLKEPAAVLFSALNLLAHVNGFVSYYRFVFHKLPLRSGGRSKAPYEYAKLWVIYAVFAIISWVCGTVVHVRSVTITRLFDYASAVALLGCWLIITVIRVANLKNEAAKIIVAFAIASFTATHITVFRFYNFDYGRNMRFCMKLEVAQLLLWAGWAGLTHHQALSKVRVAVVAAILSSNLEILGFRPFWGVLDAHALWHLCTIPITVLWWSFIKEDASGKVSKRGEAHAMWTAHNSVG